MELATAFVESDGSVVVNFGILTGREATIAEVDRLARSLALADGDDEISITSQRVHGYAGGVETVVHQVGARAAGVDPAEVERLATLWVHECADDRHVAPL